jgi:isoleucyl-tRNA synthetase
LSDWKPSAFQRSKHEEETWATLFRLRELAQAELEKARQNKLIGKALEAKVTLTLPRAEAAICRDLREPLRELLNVSQLELSEGPAETPPSVTVQKADGQKCERCWHWETDVGKDSQHPTICGRCVEAVKQAN